MNDNDFAERLWANPHDNSPEFLRALGTDESRLAAQREALVLDASLKMALESPAPAAGLFKRLMQIPADSRPVELPMRIAANDDSFLRRILPVAAVLLIALGIGTYFKPDAHSELAQDLFAHVYLETPYMDPDGSYTLDAVNNRLISVVGAHLEVSPATESLQVSFVKDCWVAQQVAMHLVVHGSNGDVNVMLLPEQVSGSEFTIVDDQLSGIVAPASRGTLVVIGNKEVPITEYRNLLSSNLGWEY